MTLLKCLPIVLIVLGGILIWISFTSEDNITGLWVAGKDFRDKEFIEGGKFRRRTYLLLRIIGLIALAAGIVIVFAT